MLKIVLDGTNAGGQSRGLVIAASKSVIRGLVISNFRQGGISLGGKGHKIEGNFIGTNAFGDTRGPGNGLGVTIGSNSTIGGTSPDKRNLISGNDGTGIQVFGYRNKIEGNLIGTAKDGISPLGNGVVFSSYGVFVLSSLNTIGDSDPRDGATNAANTIAFNNGNGVALSHIGAVPDTAGNRILSNSIFSNAKLGINFINSGTEDANGVTANDGDDPNTSKPDPDSDTGYNNLQNYPVLSSAQIFDDPFTGDTTVIEGNLTSTPGKTFTIQFFSNPEKDPSEYGEGKTFLGQIQVKTDKQGNASFNFATGAASEGEFITATATNKKGDTSEFSEAREVVEPPPPVIGP